jgi:hypothetical protein
MIASQSLDRRCTQYSPQVPATAGIPAGQQLPRGQQLRAGALTQRNPSRHPAPPLRTPAAARRAARIHIAGRADSTDPHCDRPV